MIRRRFPPVPTAAGPQAPHGATLTEVLVSLLIMGIGLVSVFTLFPLSLLISIKSNQLTNGKILVENMQEYERASAALLRPPIRDVSLGGTQSWSALSSYWQPMTAYVANQVVLPPLPPNGLLPTPFLAYVCLTGGTSGSSPPVWTTTGTVSDGTTVTWAPLSLAATFTMPSGVDLPLGHYVVDPLGLHREGNNSRPAFGNNLAVDDVGALLRTSAAFNTYLEALPIFALPDTWTVDFEAVPDTETTGAGQTVYAFPATMTLPELSTDPALTRAVMSDSGGTRSQKATVSMIDPVANEVTVDGTFSNLLGPLRIETYAPRYSCFFTVRRAGPLVPPKVTAVIVFNRSFNLENEQLYQANLGNPSFNAVAQVDGTGLSSDQIRLWWDTTASQPEPLVREGNFIFDSGNCLWYRIVDPGTVTSVTNGSRRTVTVDRPIEVISDPFNNNTATDVGHVILLPGIVNLYEL